MTLARWRAAAARLAAALALLVVATGAGEWLGAHTDDGCRTETHCLLCRAGQGHAAATPVPVVQDAVHFRAIDCAPARPEAPVTREGRAFSTRGPPAHFA